MKKYSYEESKSIIKYYIYRRIMLCRLVVLTVFLSPPYHTTPLRRRIGFVKKAAGKKFAPRLPKG